jgi:hypothetical protein
MTGHHQKNTPRSIHCKLDVLTSAKLALAMAMSDANMSNVALAYFGQQLELSVTTINHIKQLDTLIMNQ